MDRLIPFYLLLSLLLTSFGASANSSLPIQVFFHVDLSTTMKGKLAPVTQVASAVVDILAASCGPIEVGVSNILYADQYNEAGLINTESNINGGFIGGELIYQDHSPAILSGSDNGFRALVAQRLLMGFPVEDEDEGLGPQGFYTSGGSEKTYTSVVHTLNGYLLWSPKIKHQRSLVVSILLTDAVPAFEENLTPDQAFEKVRSLPMMANKEFLVGALGAGKREGCVDNDIGRPVESSTGVPDYLALEKFARLSGGEHWNICGASQKISESFRQFMVSIMKKANCALLVAGK